MSKLKNVEDIIHLRWREALEAKQKAGEEDPSLDEDELAHIAALAAVDFVGLVISASAEIIELEHGPKIKHVGPKLKM